MDKSCGQFSETRAEDGKLRMALPFCHFCKKGLFLPFSAHFLNMKNWPKKVNLYFFAHFSIISMHNITFVNKTNFEKLYNNFVLKCPG